MSILEKAKELGQEIASSAELEQMKEAEQAMMDDPGASSLVREFNEKQRKYLDLQSGGKDLPGDLAREAEDLEARVMDNPLIVDFFRKQQEFERIIEQINDIIASAISGGESGCAGDCSDDCCSSCNSCS